MIIKVERESLLGRTTIIAKKGKVDTFTVNGQPCGYDVDKFIFLIHDLISDWPDQLANDTIIDGVSYNILVKKKEGKRTIVFRNEYPKDIDKLNEIISEVVNYNAKVL